MEILLIVALIITLIWLSRALTRLGNYMTSLGESMIACGHRLSSYKPNTNHKWSPHEPIKEGEKDDYDERVREEIEQLTEPESTDFLS